jgi:hypothetical protein
MSQKENEALNADWRTYLKEMSKQVAQNPGLSKVLGSSDKGFKIVGVDKEHVVTASKGEHHYFDPKSQKEVQIAHREGWGDPEKLLPKNDPRYNAVKESRIEVNVSAKGAHTFKGDGRATWADVIRAATQHQMNKAGLRMEMGDYDMARYQIALYDSLKDKYGGGRELQGLVPTGTSINLDGLPEFVRS